MGVILTQTPHLPFHNLLVKKPRLFPCLVFWSVDFADCVFVVPFIIFLCSLKTGRQIQSWLDFGLMHLQAYKWCWILSSLGTWYLIVSSCDVSSCWCSMPRYINSLDFAKLFYSIISPLINWGNFRKAVCLICYLALCATVLSGKGVKKFYLFLWSVFLIIPQKWTTVFLGWVFMNPLV